MKITLYTIFAISLLTFLSCGTSETNDSESDVPNKTTPQRVPLKTVDETIAFINDNFKDSSETLWIADTLNDKAGINMAIIMATLLNAGYMPDGSEAKDGCRIHKYKKTDVR